MCVLIFGAKKVVSSQDEFIVFTLETYSSIAYILFHYNLRGSINLGKFRSKKSILILYYRVWNWYFNFRDLNPKICKILKLSKFLYEFLFIQVTQKLKKLLIKIRYYISPYLNFKFDLLTSTSLSLSLSSCPWWKPTSYLDIVSTERQSAGRLSLFQSLIVEIHRRPTEVCAGRLGNYTDS